MPLKVELKPGEKIIIGDCVVTNSDQRARLFIEGKAPILRQKDILTEQTANTPSKRVYFAVQLMYLENDIERLRTDYFTPVNEIISARTSRTSIIDQINNEILTGNLYKALRTAKKLVQYEEDLIANAQSGSIRLPERR